MQETIRPHILTIIHTEQGEIEVSSVHYRVFGTKTPLDETCIFGPFDYSKVMGTYDDHNKAVQHVLTLIEAGVFEPATR